MLHQAILPHHTKWAQFFENLRYIVIDEVHTYRGVFGSHVTNVLRRLKRICAFYGVQPQFILCSATIGNPQAHAEALIEAPVTAITESGAQRAKQVLLWNPPVINPDLGLRASARSQSNRIARIAIKSGLKTLVFAQTRLMVEVLTKYLKDIFDHDPRKPPRVRAYRGGYLPTERRETERAMRAGNIDGIVSTSALELGVDIGSLDVVILNGYPGSVAPPGSALAVPVAASSPRWGDGGQFAAAGPVRGAASGLLRRGLARARAYRAGPAADPVRPYPVRGLRAAVPGRRWLRPDRSGGIPGSAGRDRSDPPRRRALGMDCRQLSRQCGQPARGGRR